MREYETTGMLVQSMIIPIINARRDLNVMMVLLDCIFLYLFTQRLLFFTNCILIRSIRIYQYGSNNNKAIENICNIIFTFPYECPMEKHAECCDEYSL